ncbi:voltage-gated sodium channel [Salirhabdus euzebyi]|uniref:Voltage-gated sodium channel n=1 Tax=Salirhabdus euzebyi TaxID=394506 RepID=A0A841Q9E8_9BACI|nr:ion transporter [Salirhabdus euzebyi]MBB6454924.1 voltage-gated sodium channel [Salirhabdus euzebyi]
MSVQHRTHADDTGIASFIKHKYFNVFITTLIIINAILIGLETYPTIYEPNRSMFLIADYIILFIFVVEVLLKLWVYKMSFFKNSWNNFDFLIIVGSVVLYSTPFVSVLRIFRVLRVMRTISSVPSLRRIVSALFMAIPTIGSVVVLMSIIFYVYAVIGTSFFAGVSPEYFGNIQLTLITLFQVFTLESWASGVFRPVFSEIGWSWLYFVSFIVIATFIMINLIVGEIVNNAQKLSEEIEKETDNIKEDTIEIRELKNEVRELKDLLKTYISKKES